jgi:hypothetical protein
MIERNERYDKKVKLEKKPIIKIYRKNFVNLK